MGVTKVIRWVLLAFCVAVIIVGGRSLPVRSVVVEPPMESTGLGAIAQSDDIGLLRTLGDEINFVLEQQELGVLPEDGEARVEAAIERLHALPTSVFQQSALAHGWDVLGSVRFARGDARAALKIWQQAEAIYRTLRPEVEEDEKQAALKVELDTRLQNNLNNQSQAQQHIGLSEQSIPTLLASLNTTALTLDDVLQDPLGVIEYWDTLSDAEIHALTDLGDVLRKGGYFDEAVMILEKLEKKVGQPEFKGSLLKGSVLLALGNIRYSQGDSDRAQKAASSEIQFSVNFCPNLSDVENGDWREVFYPKANDYYVKLIEEFSVESDLGLKARISKTSLDLFLEYSSHGEGEKIQDRHPIVEVLSTRLKPEQIAQPSLQMSLLHYAQALRCYAQTVDDFQRNAEWSRKLSRYYMRQATDLLNAIIEVNLHQNNPQILSYGYGYLGELKEFEYKQLNREVRIKANKHTVAQDPLLIAAKELTLKALSVSDNSDLLYYQWLWQIARLLHLAPDKSLALDSLGYYQIAYETLQNLRGKLVAFSQAIQYDFRDRVEPLYREYVDLLLIPENSNKKVSSEHLKKARQIIESLQLIELDQFFQDDCTQFAKINVEEVDKTAAFLYTIILHDRIEVIFEFGDKIIEHHPTAITKKPVDFSEFITTPKDNLEVLASPKNRRQEYDYYFDFFKKSSEEIYEWLIRPFLKDLKKYEVETLVFSLDDVLQTIPLAALIDRESTNIRNEPVYLIEQFALAVVPSSQIFSPQRVEDINVNLLGVAVSDFKSHGDSSTWPPLLKTKDEILRLKDQICSLKKVQKDTHEGDTKECSRATILIDGVFSKARFKEEIESGEFSIVHIATHGQFSSDRTLTYLLAADKQISLDDLAAMVDNIPKTKQENLELLILSACKTAESDRRAALGMAGTALRVGARSTVASLWTVLDGPTADLMNEFYRVLLQSPEKGKAYALQEAQRGFINNQGGRNNPSAWSPFVLIGNWL